MKKEIKKYPCKNCNTMVVIRSKGLCTGCRTKERIKEGLVTVKKFYITPITDKTKKKKQEKRKALDVYFKYHLQELEDNPFSEESNKVITDPTTANVCHLLDKGRHPSVQGNLENVIYLTLQEHTRFDKLLYEHNFKALELEFICWEKVCKRFDKLLPLCLDYTKFYFNIKEYLEKRVVG